jgi:hypothetical protein
MPLNRRVEQTASGLRRAAAAHAPFRIRSRKPLKITIGERENVGMDDLGSVLAGLGVDPQRTARILDWAGIRGHRHSTSKCPVANFVRLYYPEAYDVVVTPSRVCVWEERDSFPSISAQAPTPPWVRDFVSAFDRGKHPRLDLQQRAELEALQASCEQDRDPYTLRGPLRVPV